MQFKPHSLKQEQALFSDKKILAYLTGIQVGKTTVGALRTKVRMHTYTSPEDNFLVAAPTYKIMQQSTLPAFLKFMDGFGIYSKSDAVFKMHGGGQCYMRTATEPDSIVGLTNVRHIWVDEAGKVSLYFFENIMARSAFRDCQIDLTSSPYTLNWLYKQIVLPKMKDPTALPNIDLIQAASWENPYMPVATIEHARATMDARRFNALFGGQWERMTGLVYDCFHDEENLCEMPEFPKDTQFFGGIDWGYTHPFVLVVHALTPSGHRFQVEEFYRAGMMLPDLAIECKKRMDKWNIKRFYADPSQPGSIEYFSRQGCPTIAANNDIRVGIDHVYEQLKTRRFKFVKGMSPHTLDEIETYHYPEPKDLKPDQDTDEEDPVKQNDDACDALRYCVIMTTHSNIKFVPHAPRPRKARTEVEKIKALMREKPTLT